MRHSEKMMNEALSTLRKMRGHSRLPVIGRLEEAIDAAKAEQERDRKHLIALRDSCLAMKDALNTICNNDRRAVKQFAEHQIALINRRYEAITIDIDAKMKTLMALIGYDDEKPEKINDKLAELMANMTGFGALDG